MTTTLSFPIGVDPIREYVVLFRMKLDRAKTWSAFRPSIIERTNRFCDGRQPGLFLLAYIHLCRCDCSRTFLGAANTMKISADMVLPQRGEMPSEVGRCSLPQIR